MKPHRLLQVTAPSFCAGAIYRLEPEGWRCVKAAPILHKLYAMTPEQARDFLNSRRWRWEWVEAWKE